MWAQRPKLILLTVCLEDCKDPNIKVEKDRLFFKSVGGTDKKEHAIDIKFFKDIDPDVRYYSLLITGIVQQYLFFL